MKCIRRKQTRKCVKNERDTLKAAEMRKFSLKTFSESNARLGHYPVLKKPEIMEVKQCNIYVKKIRMN